MFPLSPAAQESGLIGSKHFAAVHAGKKQTLDGAIIMDEVGWSATDGPGVQFETYDRPDTLEAVQLLGQSAKAFGNFERTDLSTAPYGSDHMSFLKRGEEQARGVVLIINTDDRDYPHYHQSSDSIDHIDFGLMESMGRMVGAAAALHASPSRHKPGPGPSSSSGSSSSSSSSSASEMVEAEYEKRAGADETAEAQLVDEWIAALQPAS